MIWLDCIVIGMISFSTLIRLGISLKEARRSGQAADLLGTMTAALINIYIIWRLWP